MTDNLLRASVNFPYFFNFKDHFGDVPKKKKKKRSFWGFMNLILMVPIDLVSVLLVVAD